MLNNVNLYINHIVNINKTACETKDISIYILEELDKQNESLIRTNKNLNESEELLNKSNKLLHLMTWTGWFMSFIPFKSYFDNWYNQKSKFDTIDLKGISTIDADTIDNKHTNLSYDTMHLGLTSIEQEELNKLEQEINDLSYIGKEIGKHLDNQNESIDIMQKKIQILSDVTKKTNKKTSDFL